MRVKINTGEYVECDTFLEIATLILNHSSVIKIVYILIGTTSTRITLEVHSSNNIQVVTNYLYGDQCEGVCTMLMALKIRSGYV